MNSALKSSSLSYSNINLTWFYKSVYEITENAKENPYSVYSINCLFVFFIFLTNSYACYLRLYLNPKIKLIDKNGSN